MPVRYKESDLKLQRLKFQFLSRVKRLEKEQVKTIKKIAEIERVNIRKN